MEMVLQRRPSVDGATIGELTVNGIHQCYTCEDVVRPDGEKVDGKTAIPAGRYKVIVTFSNRFQQRMPLVLAVPGFSGIRIHPGNTAADTLGCLLVGRTHTANTVGESRLAYEALFPEIDSTEGDIWIDIRNAP